MRAVNLLPADPGRAHGLPGSAAVVAAVAAPLVATGLIAGGYVLEHSSVVNKRSQLAALRTRVHELPPAKPSGQPINPAVGAQAALWLGALDSALANRVSWDKVLGQLAQVVPSDVWLTTLTLDSPSASSSSTSSNGFSVGGYTYSQDAVANLLQRLALLPSLSDVTLSSSTAATLGTSSLVQFQVTASLVPPTPAPGSTPTGTASATSPSAPASTASTGAGST